MEMETSKVHVALLCSPGMGHLIPFLELATRLSTCQHLTVTIFIVLSHSSAENKLIASAKSANLFAVVQLPLSDMSAAIPDDSSVVSRIVLTMRHTVPSFRSALTALPSSPSILIADLFSTESFAVADEFHMAKYVFVASNAWFLALAVYLRVLDKQVVGQYVDQKEPLEVPGCKPIRPRDVVSPMLDRTEHQYAEFVRISADIARSDGILVNTWEDLEGGTLEAFGNRTGLGRIMKNPVYAIGPIARRSESANEGKLFEWLGKQEDSSVIYVSFGSGGTLSFEQTREMAWGLEMSGERFVWVVRAPTVRTSDMAYLTTTRISHDPNNLRSFLPEGFLERTCEVGFVVWMWAEQAAVLGHPAVGGFFTHGGWNSALEGITNGLPMIMWPLYAEQRMNATMLAEEVGVAVRPAALPTEEVVGREEIAAMVKKIMAAEDEEGKLIRTKAKQLKLSAHKASNEGGSSYRNFSLLVKLFGSL